MLAELRAGAIDHALVADDPETALALAGTADVAIDHLEPTVDEPIAVTMLAVSAIAADGDRALDEGAWAPGTDTDPLVLAGAAATVQLRDVSLNRAAMLADCVPTAVENAIENRRHRKRSD